MKAVIYRCPTFGDPLQNFHNVLLSKEVTNIDYLSHTFILTRASKRGKAPLPNSFPLSFEGEGD